MSSPSTIVEFPDDSQLRDGERTTTPVAQSPLLTPSRRNGALVTQNPTVVDRTLAGIASLTQLLPTGTVLAFQVPASTYILYTYLNVLMILIIYICMHK
jgi:hypothetical protein